MAYENCDCGWPLGCSYCDAQEPCPACLVAELLEGVAEVEDVAVGMLAEQDSVRELYAKNHGININTPAWYTRLREALDKVS